MRRRWTLVPAGLVLLAALEIVAFVVVARWLGVAVAVLLQLAASTAGALLVRREGVRGWRRFRAAGAAGQPPGPQVTDGLVGLVAALLVAVPGFVTAAAGALTLVPPLRRMVGVGVRRAMERRMSSTGMGDLFGPRRVRVRQGPPTATPPAAQPDEPAGGGAAIEGEIVDG